MKKFLVILALFCIALPQFAHAGAWTLPKNNIWAEYYMKWNWSRNDFWPNEDLGIKGGNLKGARSWGWSMAPKVEYGITDWFTAFVSTEYKEATYKEYDRPSSWGTYVVKNHGLTNTDFGGRIRFLKDPVVLSAQAKVEIYSGYDKVDLTDQPGLSDRADMLELRALIGKKFDLKPFPCYLGAETGYRFKNHNLCDDVPFFVEGGFWPLKWLLLKAEIDGFWSNDASGKVEKEYAIWRVGPVFQLLGGDNEITRMGGKGLSINVGVQYGQTFWGRNTSADEEIVLKVSAQY